jgi:hypothetical protein
VSLRRALLKQRPHLPLPQRNKAFNLRARTTRAVLNERSLMLPATGLRGVCF